MKTSQNGRKLIEEFEGLFLKTYDDANDRIVAPGDPVRGVLTIGYGHTTAAGPPTVHAGMTITRELADQYLANDLSKVEADVMRLVKVPLNQNQFDALVSFTYNLGAGNLAKSTLLKKLNNKDYNGAAGEFAKWTGAKQIGSGPVPGLVRRRAAEKKLFLSSNTASHGGAGAVIVAGGAAVTQAPTNWIPWVIGGTIVIAIITWFIIKHFRKVDDVIDSVEHSEDAVSVDEKPVDKV